MAAVRAGADFLFFELPKIIILAPPGGLDDWRCCMTGLLEEMVMASLEISEKAQRCRFY